MIKFINVPVEIWHLDELQPGERMLLALIMGFTTAGKGCMMSNDALGEVLHVSSRTARRYLAHLSELGLVQLTDEGGHRVARGVAKAVARGGGQSCGQGGGQSCVHHIQRDIKDDIKIIETTMMEKPTVEDVASYMATTDRVRECRLRPSEIKTMAADAVGYYNAAEWRTKDGTQVKRWRPLMRSWAARALKDYRPPQQRPRATAEDIRRDIEWHSRRAVGYIERGQPHLAHGEQQAIKALRHALDEVVSKQQ